MCKKGNYFAKFVTKKIQIVIIAIPLIYSHNDMQVISDTYLVSYSSQVLFRNTALHVNCACNTLPVSKFHYTRCLKCGTLKF